MTNEQLEQIREMIAEPSPKMMEAALAAFPEAELATGHLGPRWVLEAMLISMAEPMHTAIFGESDDQ